MPRYNPPEVEPDAGDSSALKFKLPNTRVPEPILPGIRGWRTQDGYLILRLHYTCDPERATQEWIEETVKGYTGGLTGSMWQREMEIDFGSYSGLPVYPEFDKNRSVTQVKYNPHLPLWRGWDFGYRNPAVVFLQLWPDNTLVLLHELFPTLDKEALPGISTENMVRLVIAETDRLFPNANDPGLTAGVYDFCDPAGNQKKETSDFSSIEVLQKFGLEPEYAVVGRKSRIDYARVYIEGKHEDGKPMFLINSSCPLSIEAFAAAYRFPESDKGKEDREMPDLSRKIQEQPYIHIMDSFEYVVACNLEITFPSHTGVKRTEAPDTSITDLATAYLNASAPNTRQVDSVPLTPDISLDDLEGDIVSLIGEDSLEDAWSLL